MGRSRTKATESLLWSDYKQGLDCGFVEHSSTKSSYIELSLFHTVCALLRYVLSLPSPLYLHHCPLLPSSRSQRIFYLPTAEGRSYFTTDGQSVSQYVLVSSTFVGLAPRYCFLSECCCLKFEVLFQWGAISDEKTGLQFTVWSLNDPSRAEPVTILCLNFWDSPNLEGKVPIFISPRNKVARLYTRVLGSFYVVSYYSPLTTRDLWLLLPKQSLFTGGGGERERKESWGVVRDTTVLEGGVIET
jgi:hypothetical protein